MRDELLNKLYALREFERENFGNDYEYYEKINVSFMRTHSITICDYLYRKDFDDEVFDVLLHKYYNLLERKVWRKTIHIKRRIHFKSQYAREKYFEQLENEMQQCDELLKKLREAYLSID